MLMESFEVENFRSLKHLKLEKLARVNLLVGKNNSGKTSVLEGLYILANVDQPNWYDMVNRDMEKEQIDADFFFYKFNAHAIIEFKATYVDKESTEASSHDSLRVALQNPNRLERKDEKNLDAIIKGRAPIRARVPNAGHLLQVDLYILNSTIPLSFEADLRADSSTGFSGTHEEDPSVALAHLLPEPLYLRTIARIIETHTNLYITRRELQPIIIEQAQNKIIEILRLLEPTLESIAVVGNDIYFGLGKGFPKLVPLNLMGEGMHRLLSIVTSISTLVGGLVCIDEIDNGLHHSALRILWKGILQAAREYDVQVFATTHSAEALRHLTTVLEDEEYAAYRNDIAAYTLIRAKDDTVRSYRYDYEQLGFAMEHDVEVRN